MKKVENNWELDLAEQLNKPKSLFSNKEKWLVQYVKALLLAERKKMKEEVEKIIKQLASINMEDYNLWSKDGLVEDFKKKLKEL